MSTSDDFIRFANLFARVQQPYKSILLGVFNYRSVGDYCINVSLFPDSGDVVLCSDIWNAIVAVDELKCQSLDIGEDVALSSLSTTQKDFFIKTIQYVVLYCDLLTHAIYIEAEKGGYVLDSYTKHELLESIEGLENVLYGPRIADIAEEKESVLRYFSQLFKRRGWVLSPDDQKIFSDFLVFFDSSIELGEAQPLVREEGRMYDGDVLWEIFSRVYDLYEKKSCKVYIQKTLQDGYCDGGAYYIPASWRDGEKNAFYEKCNILSHVKICFSEVVSNVSVGLSWLSGSHSIVFPYGASYSWKRICELLDHEVATHFVRNENAFQGCGVRSADYLSTEEGLAMVNEDMVSVLNFDDLTERDPTLHHLSVFIAEHHDYAHTSKLLYIYFLMSGFSSSDALLQATSRAMRVKRFHSLDVSGSSRKDVCYWRGNKRIYHWCRGLGYDDATLVHLLYSGKFSLEDLDFVIGDESFSSNVFTPPIFVGKLLYGLSQGYSLEQLYDEDCRFSVWGFSCSHSQEEKIKAIFAYH